MPEVTRSAARRCSSCGRVRAECRTPDQPFLSCCNDCAANDGDTHSAPKGEVCTGPCDHDKHERRGPTWFGWYEPATAATLDLLLIGEDADWIVAFGHHNLVEFAVRAYDFGRYEDLDVDELRDAVIASRHTYARGPTPEDYADIEDEEERAHALSNALEEDWMFWTDEPTDRPVTITGRLT